MGKTGRKYSYAGLVPPGIPRERAFSCLGWIWGPLESLLSTSRESASSCAEQWRSKPFLLVSRPGEYSQEHPGFLERLPLSVRAEMSLQGDEWVLEGVAASPAWGMSTHVTSRLCKNWATFGQGGEVLAKVVSLLTDSYLLRGGKTTIRRSVCTALEGIDRLLSCQWPPIC